MVSRPVQTKTKHFLFRPNLFDSAVYVSANHKFPKFDDEKKQKTFSMRQILFIIKRRQVYYTELWDSQPMFSLGTMRPNKTCLNPCDAWPSRFKYLN